MRCRERLWPFRGIYWDNHRPPAQRNQPPTTAVIARGVSPVAIRISPAPAGLGGALRRRGYGLPRLRLAMTVMVDGLSCCFDCVVVQVERQRGLQGGDKIVGNAVSGVPGDREGRPYAIL